MTELQRQLRAGEYAAVARVLIEYYDKLYDAHTQNGSGSGSGTGCRPGAVLEAVHPEELPKFDAALLAREVLKAVRKFEAQERARAPARGAELQPELQLQDSLTSLLAPADQRREHRRSIARTDAAFGDERGTKERPPRHNRASA